MTERDKLMDEAYARGANFPLTRAELMTLEAMCQQSINTMKDRMIDGNAPFDDPNMDFEVNCNLASRATLLFARIRTHASKVEVEARAEVEGGLS